MFGMNMQNTEFEKLLPQDDFMPACPTDKFVAGFLAQMDKDLPVQNARVANDNFGFWMRIGAVAALILVVSGLVFVNSDMSGLIFNNKSQTKIIAQIDTPQPPEQMAMYDVYYSQNVSGQDAFASQLIGYEDISTVVPVAETPQKQP